MDTFLYVADDALDYPELSNVTWLTNLSMILENSTQYYDLPDSDMDTLVDMVIALDTYFVPVLIILGLVLNICVVLTIRLTDLKNVPACFCFLSLGIIDTVYLVAISIPWISKFTVDIYNSKGFCQLTYYLNILSSFLSSWYIVIILFERTYVSLQPNSRSKLFCAFRTKCYVTIFSIFSIVAHLYLTWTSGVYRFNRSSHCMVLLDHWEDIQVMRKIDIFFSFFLPVALCVAMSTAIIILNFGRVKRSDKELKEASTPHSTTEIVLNLRIKGVSNHFQYSSISEHSRQERKRRINETSRSKQLTVSCLIITFVYVVLTMPHNILKTKITFSSVDYDVTMMHDSMYLQILEKIYAINFVYKATVYFIALPEMRRCLIGLLTSFRKYLPMTHTRQKQVATVL